MSWFQRAGIYPHLHKGGFSYDKRSNTVSFAQEEDYEQCNCKSTSNRPFTMIAEAAYYLAEQRGFSSGDPVKDWLDAEELINPSHAPKVTKQRAKSQ